MSKDRDSLPGKKEEQDSTLAKIVSLAPLFELILRLLELLLKLLGAIN